MTFYRLLFTNSTSGDWRIRQDTATMGPHDGAMRHDDGHPLGNLTSHNAQSVRLWRRPASNERKLDAGLDARSLLRTDPTICGWDTDYVRGLCWWCAVLGICARQRQWRRCCAHVGQSVLLHRWPACVLIVRLPAPTVRTGQSHRTLTGHTEPVTCLSFDELHVVSGSLDKTIRVRCLVLSVSSSYLYDAFRYGTFGQGMSLRHSSTTMASLLCSLIREKSLLLLARTASKSVR